VHQLKKGRSEPGAAPASPRALALGHSLPHEPGSARRIKQLYA